MSLPGDLPALWGRCGQSLLVHTTTPIRGSRSAGNPPPHLPPLFSGHLRGWEAPGAKPCPALPELKAGD